MAEAPVPAPQPGRLAPLRLALGRINWLRLWRVVYQISTIKGVLRGLCSIGVLNLAPLAQDQIATLIFQFLAGCQAIIAVIDIARDDRKGENITDTVPVQAGAATVETKV